MPRNLFAIIMLMAINLIAHAQIATPQILSSNMVLQQEQKIPLWGNAQPNERIRITFDKQKISVHANSNGQWEATLNPMKANKTPRQLIIKGKDSTIVYENIVIGEVWLCAGQSNMEYRMKLIPQFAPPVKGEDLAALELQKPANDMIRVFVSERKHRWNEWKVADGNSLTDVSAAGYFFAKTIQEKLDVPIGIITATLGGTHIETWTPAEAYENSPIFAQEFKNNRRINGIGAGQWYNEIIKPIIPYAIHGFLWYQGENNCGSGDRRYAEKFRLMVDTWRTVFNATEAPFYYVLLGPHIYSDRMHRHSQRHMTAEDLPLFRQQQIEAKTLVSNSEYIVISDLIDDLHDIHPSYKWEVGARLARIALAKNYGQINTIWSGPRIKETQSIADSIIVSFDHCADGLKTNDGKFVNWFDIAGKDGIFRPALAEIKGKNQVKIYHPDIKHPAKVRLGWHETAIPNLVNSEGLPVTPFKDK